MKSDKINDDIGRLTHTYNVCMETYFKKYSSCVFFELDK